MRKPYELITSKELSDLLVHEEREQISFGITMSNKKVFKDSKASDKSTDKVRKVFKR